MIEQPATIRLPEVVEVYDVDVIDAKVVADLAVCRDRIASLVSLSEWMAQRVRQVPDTSSCCDGIPPARP